MGRRILHTGPLGSASVLKVVTNYLATANLVSLCEALATAKMAGMDLNTTYEAIRISSGNSFVHETESQVILNGSRDINFTMDLVSKDIGIFGAIAERAGVPLEIAPLLIGIFKDGEARYGPREWSPNIVRRLEEACGIEIRAPGFPAEMVDDEPEQPGYEVVPRGRGCGTKPGRGRGAPACNLTRWPAASASPKPIRLFIDRQIWRDPGPAADEAAGIDAVARAGICRGPFTMP